MEKKDLTQIKEEFTQVIVDKVNPQFKQIRQEFAQVIEDNINPQFEEIREDIRVLKNDVSGLKNDVGGLKGDIHQIKATMVTKSYLDDKLADLEGGLISKIRKEDIKVNLLIEIMKKKSLLSKTEVKELNELKVFPRISNQES